MFTTGQSNSCWSISWWFKVFKDNSPLASLRANRILVMFLSLFVDINYETTFNWVNPEWTNLKVFSETNSLYEIIFMRCLERGEVWMNLKLKIPTSGYPFMWFLFDGMFLFVIFHRIWWEMWQVCTGYKVAVKCYLPSFRSGN